MANYFNTLPLREQLNQLGQCEFMDSSEFSDGVEALKGKKIVIVGAGAQGLNQGLNMRDSGLDISYALRQAAIDEKRASYVNATENGFTVGTYEELIPSADLVINLTPDKQHTNVVQTVMPLMKQGATLSYSHGFNIVEEGMQIREDLTVIMVAPKSPGSEVREEYKRGFGVPTLIAVHPENDPEGKGWAQAQAYAVGTGGDRAGCLKEMESKGYGSLAATYRDKVAKMRAKWRTSRTAIEPGKLAQAYMTWMKDPSWKEAPNLKQRYAGTKWLRKVLDDEMYYMLMTISISLVDSFLPGRRIDTVIRRLTECFDTYLTQGWDRRTSVLLRTQSINTTMGWVTADRSFITSGAMGRIAGSREAATKEPHHCYDPNNREFRGVNSFELAFIKRYQSLPDTNKLATIHASLASMLQSN